MGVVCGAVVTLGTDLGSYSMEFSLYTRDWKALGLYRPFRVQVIPMWEATGVGE